MSTTYTEAQLRRKPKAELIGLADYRDDAAQVTKTDLIRDILDDQEGPEDDHYGCATDAVLDRLASESMQSPAHRILSRTRGQDRYLDLAFEKNLEARAPQDLDGSIDDVFEFRRPEGSFYRTEAEVMGGWDRIVAQMAMAIPDHDGWGFLQEQMLDGIVHSIHRRLSQTRSRINDMKAEIKSHSLEADGTEIWSAEAEKLQDRFTDLRDQESFLEAALTGAEKAYRSATGSYWSPSSGQSNVKYHRLTASNVAAEELTQQRMDEERTRIDIEQGFALVVTGGREFTDTKAIWARLDSALIRHRQRNGDMPLVLFHGNARGVDKICGAWAAQKDIPTVIFTPKWEQFGKRAGWMRNERMLDFAQKHAKACGLLAFPGGAGTAHCIDSARKKGVVVVSAFQKK